MTRNQTCPIYGEKYDLIVEWWWWFLMVSLSTALPTFLYMNHCWNCQPGQSHILRRLQGGYLSCWFCRSFLKTNNEHWNWFCVTANNIYKPQTIDLGLYFRWWATVGWGYAFTFQCFWPYHRQEPHGHLCMFRGKAKGWDLWRNGCNAEHYN